MPSTTIGNAGNSFVCSRCGACCRVPGYVHLSLVDIEAIARVLSLSVDAFTERYTRLTGNRAGLSLTEKPDGSCVLLEDGNRCRIEAVKPGQCRDFPVTWQYRDMREVCEAWRDHEDS